MTVSQRRLHRQTSSNNPRNITAGVTLKAVDALRDPNVQHFTRDQVAYLMHLAFLSGAEHRRAHDTAEMIASWDVAATVQETRAQRIAWELELAERRTQIRREHETEHPPAWVGTLAGCDWPEVTQPGWATLRVAA